MIKKIYLILLSMIIIHTTPNITTMAGRLDTLPMNEVKELNASTNIETSKVKEILGFSRNTNPTLNEINRAYRELSRICHPDCQKMPKEEAEARFILLKKACDNLRIEDEKIKIIQETVAQRNRLKEEIKSNALDIIRSWHLGSDLINTIIEATRISALDSSNENLIKINAAIGFIKNAFFIDRLYKVDFFMNTRNNTKGIKYIQILKDAAKIKFMVNNLLIYLHADKIANYNHKHNQNISRKKLGQSIWLLTNKIAPYLGFILVRKIKENCNILDSFKNPDNLRIDSVKFYQLIRVMSDISEAIRTNKLHNLELDKYKQYQENNTKNIDI
ncbi:MAG: DnaJ domain-containing protein [Novosphingobium sp.]|nr:DnaJ domain-containing protein [Novosphingobium sp.]